MKVHLKYLLFSSFLAFFACNQHETLLPDYHKNGDLADILHSDPEINAGGQNDSTNILLPDPPIHQITDYETDYQPPNPSGLPSLHLETQGRSISSKTVWLEGAQYSLYNETGILLNSGSLSVKGRGNSTWDMPKKPYSLKLDAKTPLLTMHSHKRWALLANYADKTLLRTEIAFQLGYIFDNMAWTPHAKQVDLYLNGKYRGVYQLTEVVKIDANRVNITEITPTNPVGGYIVEADWREGEIFHFWTGKGVCFNCSDPDADLNSLITGATQTLFQKIQADVLKVEQVLYSSSFNDPVDGYSKYIDLPSWVDWYIVQEVTKNVDARFGLSVFMYYSPQKQKFCLGPIWDFDLGCGNVDYADSRYSTGWWIKTSPWIEQLFKSPEFVRALKARWNQKKSEAQTVISYLDLRASFLERAQTANFKKWTILNRYVWPNPVVTGAYSGEIQYVRQWLTERLAWLDQNINQLQ